MLLKRMSWWLQIPFHVFDTFSVFDHTGIYDEFAAAFTKAVQGLQVGNGLDAGVTQVRI